MKSTLILLPRLIRLRDAPAYLGMDRNRFNSDVRPKLMEVPIGQQGVACERLELDAWVDDYKSAKGQVQNSRGAGTWEGSDRRALSSGRASGISTSGSAAGTINHGLKVVRRILNLAAMEWVDEFDMTWLQSEPRIKLLPDTKKRKPYPLSWEEQERLFSYLPEHLRHMALFAVNTGCRDGEICRLQWAWEVPVPELETSTFVIPGEYVKNGDDRLIVLNKVALEVVDRMRKQHPEFVFTYKSKPVTRMLNSAWMRAREKAGLPQVRVHDLKHTFGRRLRAAGVSFEDRQDLLGHKSGRITTHYSEPELLRLLESADRVCACVNAACLTSQG